MTDPAREPFTWIPVEPCEVLSLASPKMKSCPAAEIELARIGPTWINAVAFHQWGGDFWGATEPLGHWQGQDPARWFPDRAAALADAINRLRQNMAGRPLELAAQLSWLDTLVPDQPDLFGGFL